MTKCSYNIATIYVNKYCTLQVFFFFFESKIFDYEIVWSCRKTLLTTTFTDLFDRSDDSIANTFCNILLFQV